MSRWLHVHSHHEIVHVGIPITEPPRIQELRAQAKQRLDELCIPAWEPYGRFPTGARVNVLQTWRDHGWEPRS